jgi:hypothetical protein
MKTNMVQKKILVPTTNADSWKAFLASETHWKDNYSAKSVAESWERVDGLPKEIISAFNKHESFKDSEMMLAIPEFKVPLPGGSRPSQNDLLVVTSNEDGLTLITVEAKVDEGFGETIKNWLVESSSGKKERLKYLLDTINFQGNEFENLRYQLFHRLASAIIMAKKFHAKKALMIIQSFQENNNKNHFIDYQNFILAYNVEPLKEHIQKITSVGEIDVYALWVFSKLARTDKSNF